MESCIFFKCSSSGKGTCIYADSSAVSVSSSCFELTGPRDILETGCTLFSTSSDTTISTVSILMCPYTDKESRLDSLYLIYGTSSISNLNSSQNTNAQSACVQLTKMDAETVISFLLAADGRGLDTVELQGISAGRNCHFRRSAFVNNTVSLFLLYFLSSSASMSLDEVVISGNSNTVLNSNNVVFSDCTYFGTPSLGISDQNPNGLKMTDSGFITHVSYKFSTNGCHGKMSRPSVIVSSRIKAIIAFLLNFYFSYLIQFLPLAVTEQNNIRLYF